MLVLLFVSMSQLSAQVLDVPGSDASDDAPVEAPAEKPSKSETTVQKPVAKSQIRLILKAKPLLMLGSLMMLNDFRNINGELEVALSRRLSLSMGGSYYYVNYNNLFNTVPEPGFPGFFEAYSLRTELRCILVKRKMVDSFDSMEGLYLGAYHKLASWEERLTFQADFSTRLLVNIVGLTMGYQWVFKRRISVSPMAGLGFGLARDTGPFGADFIPVPDLRGGLSIGYVIF